MNKASDVLMIVRSILRDDDFKELQFSDGELLDKLTNAQNEFISEFRENIHYLKIKPSKNELNTIDLPAKIAFIIKLELDNKPLVYASSASALKGKQPCFCHLRHNSYMLHNVKDYEELELIACFFAKEPLKSVDDELLLGYEFNHALALRVVCDIMLVELHPQTLPKMQLYQKEAKEAKDRLHALKNIASNPSITYTKHSI